MKALVFDAPGQLELREVARPEPDPGEVVIRVHHSTICGTDLRIVAGRKTRDIRYHHPIGHECAGTVAAVGTGVTGFAEGDPVSVCVVVSCGGCRECRADRENLCAGRITLGYHTDGSFAECMRIPAQAVSRGNLFRLSPEIPIDVAPLLEPLGCCINGQHEMQLFTRARGEDRALLILGAGPIGLMHLQLARAQGRFGRITVVEPLAHRREYARRFGADEAVSPGELERPAGFEDVIIAFGDVALLDVALRSAGHCGNVSLFAGFDQGSLATVDPNVIHYRQLRLTGGSESRRRDYAEALSLLAAGRLAPAPIITHRFPLDRHEEAFRVAGERTGLKVMFDL